MGEMHEYGMADVGEGLGPAPSECEAIADRRGHNVTARPHITDHRPEENER